MNANPINLATETRVADAPSANFIAESLFTFGRQIRRHIVNYPRIFIDRTDAEGVTLRRRAMDTCCRLAREFEYLAFQAFTTEAINDVNREQLEAVVMDLREKIADMHLADMAA